MNQTKLSVKLAYLLRHSTDPQYIDLDGAWADTQKIIKAMKRYDKDFNIDLLKKIVSEDEKGRYSFNENHSKIRANQGHSIPGVTIKMAQPEPPEILYHGTATRFLDNIMSEGLKPMSRQFVHISPDYETAVKVGSRHGNPIVLAFKAKEFVNDGYALYLSDNGVWQAEFVPAKYLSIFK